MNRVTGCPTCGAELAAARSLVHPDLEAAFLHPRGSWSCSGCLGIVVEEDDGVVATRVPGAVVIRAIEHLRRAQEDGRLAEEALRLANDPAMWFVSRVPEVFSLLGWASADAARVTDRCFLFVPQRRRDQSSDGQRIIVDPWNGNAPAYAVASRFFDGFDARPESITAGYDWTNLPGAVAAGAVLHVIRATPPALVLEAYAVFPDVRSTPVPEILAYVDALVPVK